ncbi:uncharacterized protein BX663DRAFT_542322 [Cokeromyces recurvatus]|uniref:uncharacterized protein n=1 Tax=Cokeromyces recurvatus TaxID=90255 RepID=UPI002220B3D2|nr:uncharacterized protein BX663DRAFT_542322 [Cokeromyces recurvatus]KAI7904031.1 hypothetical protein BX663DRAFT_542322 [Cokeromyces recurvatus]
MITKLDSLKTKEVSKLIACRKHIQSYDTMYKFYNRGLWSSKLKLRYYRKKQKAFSEIVKIFTCNSIKYHTGAITNANKTIIAYGDGRFSLTMRGKRSGPTKVIIKALQKCEQNRGVTVQMIDEYLTSQVCNNCKKRNVEKVVQRSAKRRVHSVLQCQETAYNIIWNRNKETMTLIFHHSSVLNQKNNCKYRVSLILLFDTPWVFGLSYTPLQEHVNWSRNTQIFQSFYYKPTTKALLGSHITKSVCTTENSTILEVEAKVTGYD